MLPSVDLGLHRLGWKAFQDLCIALAEERLQRPVQTFLPTSDAGRDGAFRGSWEAATDGESTIQCKFTSKPDSKLSLSMLADERAKVRRLAAIGLADDYIILTNHTVTGRSEMAIRMAFQQEGAVRCRVFHRDWIIERINTSPKLRMMVPKLYGLADLTEILDSRAYQQAQLILSEMGDNLQKLVVTTAHRKSVRAISEFNLVLLLGAPAAGKSTIGASLALGASDIWKCVTLKSTSPQHLEHHIDSKGGQFFWIDDAWGSTQYQRDRTEAWNQVFPLIQGAMKRGSRFLITSRDYVWHSARRELKLQALPVLGKSQVIINVQELTNEEKARILYNHIKMGDQSQAFRACVKPLLPALAKRDDFLPESARRLGTLIFTKSLRPLAADNVYDFFARPKEFLEQTIESLAPESRAAISLLFLNGGQVRSPVPMEALQDPAQAFGVAPARVKDELDSLRGNFLKFAEDEEGPFWTYSHPTISDAFAAYVAKSPELVEIYLRGAKPYTIVAEVVCPGVHIFGAAVIIPPSLYTQLLERIANLPASSIVVFLSYRSNKAFAQKMLSVRADIWKRLENFSIPLRDDIDVDLLTTLHKFGILPDNLRSSFVDAVKRSAVEDADDSFLTASSIGDVLTPKERADILDAVRVNVLEDMEVHIDRVSESWDQDYLPDDHFDQLRGAFKRFAQAVHEGDEAIRVEVEADASIMRAIRSLEENYSPPEISSAPTQQSAAKADSLEDLFRDIDE